MLLLFQLFDDKLVEKNINVMMTPHKIEERCVNNPPQIFNEMSFMRHPI